MDPLIAPIDGADHREVGGATVDVVPVGSGRVKRVVYPAGFRWSKNMKPEVGTTYACTPTLAFSPAAGSRASTPMATRSSTRPQL